MSRLSRSQARRPLVWAAALGFAFGGITRPVAAQEHRAFADPDGVQIRFGMQRPPSPGFAQLYMFQGAPDAEGPQTGLIVDKSGNLFGTTDIGGAFGDGAVYEVVKNGASWKERVVFGFSGSDGMSPEGTPTIDKDGNIYVTSIEGAAFGNGSIVKLSPASGGYTETAVYSFVGPEGSSPSAGLLPRGKDFYMTTTSGGAYGLGSIVLVTPSLQVTDVYDFGTSAYDGSDANSNLIADSTGALYGTTSNGGDYGLGTVFRFVPSKRGQGKLETLYSFHGGSDGATPLQGVIRDDQGALYGVTTAGGDENGDGVVFKLTPSGNYYEETILHRFSESSDGFNPVGALTFKGRVIFGTAANGGSQGGGTIFQISDFGTGYATVWNFEQDGSPGALPRCQLVSKGAALYGTTSSNVGSVALGTVFEYTP